MSGAHLKVFLRLLAASILLGGVVFSWHGNDGALIVCSLMAGAVIRDVLRDLDDFLIATRRK